MAASRATPEPMRWETMVVAGTDLDALHTMYPGWRWQIEERASSLPSLWIGTDAARTLGVALGDTLPLDALVAGGTGVRGTVGALFEAGSAEDGLVYLPIQHAERLLAAPGERSGKGTAAVTTRAPERSAA